MESGDLQQGVGRLACVPFVALVDAPQSEVAIVVVSNKQSIMIQYGKALCLMLKFQRLSRGSGHQRWTASRMEIAQADFPEIAPDAFLPASSTSKLFSK